MPSCLLLSGPSCVGKGPLLASVRRLYPEIYEKLAKVILFNDREPRPGEEDGVDYYFRGQEEIRAFPEGDYVVVEIRKGNFQALRLEDVIRACEGDRIGFLEVFHEIGAEVTARNYFTGIDVKKVFLSPLSQEEIEFLRKRERSVDLRKFTTGVIRRKLVRRVLKQKGIPSFRDLEDVEERAKTAYDEMKSASQYDYVLANHDGEDSDNWDYFYYPIGDARKTLLSFVDILLGNEPGYYERWPQDLLP